VRGILDAEDAKITQKTQKGRKKKTENGGVPLSYFEKVNPSFEIFLSAFHFKLLQYLKPFRLNFSLLGIYFDIFLISF